MIMIATTFFLKLKILDKTRGHKKKAKLCYRKSLSSFFN